MIENIEIFGPYIFLSPEIALAHAKPEDGVVDLSMSILVLGKKVYFPEEKGAKVIIVVAPVDSEKHLKALSDIVDFFSNKVNVKLLENANSAREAYEVISNFCSENMIV